MKQTSFRIDPVLHKKLKQACLDRDTDQTAALHEALLAWLEPPGQVQPTATESKRPAIPASPDHRMLDVILTKGTKDQILGIRSNLKAFNAEIELAELKASTPHARKRAG